MTSKAHIAERILDHIELHKVTTVRALSRVLAVDPRQARRYLSDLVTKRVLSRNEFVGHNSNRSLEYYARRGRRLSPGNLKRSYAIMWFSCMSFPQRPLITPRELRKILLPVTRVAGLPPPPPVPCYLDRSTRPGGRRLSLIRVATDRVYRQGLNRAMMELQDYVAKRTFGAWAFFARNEDLSVTYLIAGVELVRELSTWLERRPLLSQTRQVPVLVPVRVIHAQLP
jgi:hypothetical protein